MPAAANAPKMAGASRSATAGPTTTLGREGQPVEPGQQVEREAEAGVGQLRQVRVGVDHAGQQDPGPQVDRGDQRRPVGRRRRSDRSDPARRVDVDEGVGFVAGAAGGQRRQQPRPKRERRTLRKLATRHARRLARPDQPNGAGVAGEQRADRRPRDQTRNRSPAWADAAEGAREQGSERTPTCVNDRRSEQRADALPASRCHATGAAGRVQPKARVSKGASAPRGA